jgi:uncharacterized repeat protein (TIGR03803 family)
MRQLFYLLTVVAFMSSFQRLNGQTHSVLIHCGAVTNHTGVAPTSELARSIDGTLYGACYGGFPNKYAGTIFKVQSDGSGFKVLKWFTNNLEGAQPYTSITLIGNVLFGTTESGGTSDFGVVFRMNTDGTGYSVLKSFSGSDGANPRAGLVTDGSALDQVRVQCSK